MRRSSVVALFLGGLSVISVGVFIGLLINAAVKLRIAFREGEGGSEESVRAES